MPYIFVGGAIVAAVVIIAILCKLFYRVADANQALVITGGKELVIKPSGGSFIIPIFRKAQYFPLNMRTITSDKDEIKTSTSVPIYTDWTAQIRPKKDDPLALARAVTSFLSMGEEDVNENIKQTLTGTVRDVVSAMTPESVLKNKEEFKKNVEETVADEMQKMGMELVSLNIQDISDPNGYFDNIAAIDMADKEKAAKNKQAIISQEIRQQQALSEKEAKERELQAALSVAEKQRDNALRIAEFKTETDKANADAEIAGELQATVRRQEMAVEQGKVEVVRQEQANFAAQKQREVEITKAETKKAQAKIDADAEAQVKSIRADADVSVAEKNAKAVKITAEANADKVRKEGQAKAEIVQINGQAEADAKKAMLVAQAEAEREKQLAEADGIKAKLLAEAEGLKAKAEGEKQLAEARASNDKVNFEIEKIRLENEARITVATNMGKIMADIGKNAEFVNIGGMQNGGTGNVLTDTLSSIPALWKALNAQNEALNGCNMNEQIKQIVESTVGPVKGALSYSEGPAAATAIDSQNTSIDSAE